MKKLFAVCLLFILSQILIGQNKTIDSLKQVYTSSSKTDQQKLDALAKLRTMLSDQNEQIEYLKKQLLLSNKLKHYEMSADILSKLGWYKYVSEDYAKADSLYKSSIQICKKYKFLRVEGLNYTRLMMLNWWLGKSKEGVAFFEKAETCLLKVNAYEELGNLYLNASELYKDTKLYDIALGYAKKSVYYAEKDTMSDTKILSMAFLGDAYRASGNDSAALKILNKAQLLAKEKNNMDYLGDVNYFLGVLFYGKNDYRTSIRYFNDALGIYTKLNKRDRVVSALDMLVQLYFLNKEFEKAKDALSQIKQIIDSGNVMEQRFIYKNYANLDLVNQDIFAWKKNTDKADSLENLYTSMAVKKGILDINTKYQTSLKEKEILKLQQQKNTQRFFIIVLLVCLCSILLISFFIYRYINQKKIITENENIQLKQEKQLAVMDNVLKVQEEERGRVAKDLHDGLGGMLSGIKLNLSAMKGNVILQQHDAGLFAKSIEQLDNAISEMRRVAHNMMPESLLKFGLSQAVQDYCESLNESKVIQVAFTNLNLDERIENSVEIVLYRIIQELVNNVIKHAHAQHVFIQLSKNEHQLTLTVEDDGKGFDVNKMDNLKGFGLTNIQSRVNYLKGKLEIDSKPDIGTSFYITIPV